MQNGTGTARCCGALNGGSVREALGAAERRGNRLFFCAVAWELGHHLIDRREYGLAAECFGRLSDFAAGVADRFVLEAARISGRTCAILCEGRPVGPELKGVIEVLRRDLSQLTYEELRLAANALAVPGEDEEAHEGRAPSTYLAYERAGGATFRGTPAASLGVLSFDPWEDQQREAVLRDGAGSLGVEVRFFFPFEVLHEGRALPLGHNSKAQAILRYLLANASRAVSQDFFMGLLWPDSTPKKARWSLNSAMCALRKILVEALPERPAEGYVVCEGGYYRVSPYLRIASDVQEFDAGYRRGCHLEEAWRASDAAAEYERAIGLYRGDYLMEDLYQDWTMIERERLADAYMDMLDRLARYYLENGLFRKALHACYRALKKDPCRENSHGLLMRCHARLGFRDRALRQYRLYEEALRTRYDAAPSREIQALRKRLLAGGGI